MTQAAAGAAAPYLAQMVKQQTPEGASRVMAHALVQGALAAAQNKNAMVGATGAVTGELVGMMATELYHKDASQLTEGEKETVSTLATLAAGLAGGLTGDTTVEALAGAQTGKTVVENNSLAGDKARESLKGSNEWWKQRVRETLGENTSSQITNGVLNALTEVGDTGLLAADSAFDVGAALVTCSLGETYCNQAKSDLGKKNQAASDAVNAVMSGDAWAAVKGTVGKAAQGDQIALENLAGVLAGALVPVKGTGLIKGGDPVVTVVSKETGSNLLTAGGKGAAQVLREVEVSSGGKGAWTKELNKPEPNTIYKVDGNKIYQTDSLVRVEKVEANLSLTKNDRNTYQQCATGKCGVSGDEGGHLIASIFNGPGERLNLLPMNANLNKGAWKKMENAWASALKEGKSVSVKIEPIYNGSSVRPDRFTVRYSIGGDRPAIVDFKNSPGGI